MALDENTRIKNLIEKIRKLIDNPTPSSNRTIQVIGMSQTVLHDTVGKDHPLMKILDHALNSDVVVEAYVRSGA